MVKNVFFNCLKIKVRLIVSKIRYPAETPDVTASCNQIYRTPLRDLVDLQERIYATVKNVTLEMFLITHGSRLNTGWTFLVPLMLVMLRFMEHRVNKFPVFTLCNNIGDWNFRISDLLKKNPDGIDI